MKKLSNISESTWGDLRRRAEGVQVKKEDEIGNLYKINPIDLGGSVLWSDVDLEVDGETYFDWKELQEMLPKIEKSGWRLIKSDDLHQLEGLDLESDGKSIHIKSDGEELIFYKNGRYNGNKFIEEDGYVGWIDKTTPLSKWVRYTLYIDEDHLSADFTVIANETNKLCVRLVKDKEKERG
jgi:protein associated with RNAse G/E